MERNERIDQAHDTGLALCLFLLILTYFGHYSRLIPVSILFLFLSMVWPGVFAPLSKWWFKLSYGVSAVMSRFFLTLLFFGIVTPIGFLRSLLGADPMQFKKWKKGKGTIFYERNKAIQAKDLEQPY